MLQNQSNHTYYHTLLLLLYRHSLSPLALWSENSNSPDVCHCLVTASINIAFLVLVAAFAPGCIRLCNATCYYRLQHAHVVLSLAAAILQLRLVLYVDFTTREDGCLPRLMILVVQQIRRLLPMTSLRRTPRSDYQNKKRLTIRLRPPKNVRRRVPVHMDLVCGEQ